MASLVGQDASADQGLELADTGCPAYTSVLFRKALQQYRKYSLDRWTFSVSNDTWQTYSLMSERHAVHKTLSGPAVLLCK